jgi:hypothetical protein
MTSNACAEESWTDDDRRDGAARAPLLKDNDDGLRWNAFGYLNASVIIDRFSTSTR